MRNTSPRSVSFTHPFVIHILLPFKTYSSPLRTAVVLIDRTSVPNKVVFTSPPIWSQGVNTKTLQEGVAVDKFFAHSIGSYLRCEISKDDVGIFDTKAGQTLFGKEKDDGTFGPSFSKLGSIGVSTLSLIQNSFFQKNFFFVKYATGLPLRRFATNSS